MNPRPWPRRFPKTIRCILALISVLAINMVSFDVSLSQDSSPAFSFSGQDLWYLVKIAGTPVGFVHEVTLRRPAEPSGEDVWSTSSEMRLVLNRMGARIEIGFLSSSEETVDGHLRRVRYEMKASNQATETEAIVRDGIIEVRSVAGGKSYTSTLTYTGDLYGPEGIRRLSAVRLRNAGDKLSLLTYVAEASLVGHLSRTVISRGSFRVGNREIPALQVEETLEGMPIKRSGWLDNQGNLLQQEEPGPFGAIEVLRSDKSTASAAAGGGELPEEMYQNSIVRTNIRLSRGHPIDRLKLRLSHRNPKLGWPDLRIPNQKVLEKTDQELVLEIRRPHPAKGAGYPAVETPANREHLAPNAYIQSDDAEIRDLARKLIGLEKDAFQAAQLLRRWVAENMTFDLGIVFGPATEIFRDRRGTCVGYATVLATLARAAGIPSRVTMGYVYALGMFGGHAWAEMMIGEQWIPLDAAIVNEGVADATHLALISSSLAEGLGELSLGPAQQVFGQVGIDILEYETAGKTVTVPPGATAYTVDGDRYENPWLGVRLVKPVGFTFGRLDAVWPDRTIVELLGPAGEKAVFEQHEFFPWQEPEPAAQERLHKIVPKGREERSKMMGNEILFVDSADGQKSAAAVDRGLEIMIWRVEAKDASALIRQIMKAFEIKNR